MTRYYGWYANRPRGARRKAAAGPAADAAAPIEVAAREALPLGEARRRWAELLRRIYGVDPLACLACGGAMRIMAFITEGAVIDLFNRSDTTFLGIDSGRRIKLDKKAERATKYDSRPPRVASSAPAVRAMHRSQHGVQDAPERARLRAPVELHPRARHAFTGVSGAKGSRAIISGSTECIAQKGWRSGAGGTRSFAWSV